MSNPWYILRGEIKYGPYEYKSMLEMLQSGELYNYNYVWSAHLENWTLINDLPEFSKDRICRLLENNDPLAASFERRKGPRVPLQSPLFGHNDQSVFDGNTLSVSEGGALMLLNDPLLYPGQRILVNFRPSENNPQSFNTLCEVICKNFTKQRLNVKSGLHYAVRFLQVQNQGKTQLQNWIRTSVSKEEKNGFLKLHE